MPLLLNGGAIIRFATNKGELVVQTDDRDIEVTIKQDGLTVVDKGPGWFAVDVSGETISRTAQGQWTEGRKLNLERALRLGEELGGVRR